ncbi:MAG: hypothetical protein J7513_07880 [Solirubrobacteraceae bacterium]|nr:hypothetical protein [Solirubrobacteraceae bacterium]
MPTLTRMEARGGSATATVARQIRMIAVSVVTALAVLCSTAAGAAHAASAPSDFAGLGDWNWPTAGESQQLGADGVKAFRANLAWDWVEHTRGVRRWGGVDGLMRDASSGGYDLLLVLNGCVAWSCGTTRVAPQAPEQRAQYQSFVADAAGRYGQGGSYWAAHPELKPIRISWQIWNEVNVGADWPNPTAAGYADLLAETSGTIKRVDPSARVVSAGLAEMPAVSTGQTLTQFLTGLEQQASFRGSADVVAVHGYAENPAGTARILDAARRIMRAAGDTRPIWVTELGWASGGPAHAFVRDAAGQAAELRSAYDLLLGCRTRWGLERAYWFALSDATPAGLGEPDYWGMHTGLMDSAGAPKPALDAFREYLAGRDLPGGRGTGCALPGGDDPAATVITDPAAGPAPAVRIVKSPQYVGATGRAVVDFVTSMGNAGNAECSLNGGEWQLCATPYTLPRNLGEGTYNVQVRGVDANGRRGAPATATWTVDLTAPKTIFTKRPPRRVTSKAVTVRLGTTTSRRAAVAEQLTFQCKLNAGKWKRCQSRSRIAALKVGKQRLRVRAVDAAGNVDPRGALATFTVGRR